MGLNYKQAGGRTEEIKERCQNSRRKKNTSLQIFAVFANEKGVREKPAAQQQVIISLSTQSEIQRRTRAQNSVQITDPGWSANKHA